MADTMMVYKQCPLSEGAHVVVHIYPGQYHEIQRKKQQNWKKFEKKLQMSA